MSEVNQSARVQSLITKAKALIELSNQDIPIHRPDLKMKMAQELGPKAMELSINLIDTVAELDRRLIALEGVKDA